MNFLLFLSLLAIIVVFGILNHRHEQRKGEELAESIKRYLQ